jgi:adenylate cyclase
VAQELRELRASFMNLRSAILSWGKYVPTILLKQLYEAGVEATIGCSRSDVAIFFCDIVNFEDICHESPPRECLEMLAAVLEIIHAVIEANSGTLLEFIGDEVLAIYGAPAKVENQIELAVTAAVEIIKQSHQLEFNPKLQCSVHRASVLAGNLGSPTRMKYGVMGDGVNLTARLKSLNSRYGTQLLVSGEAMNFAGSQDQFVTRPIGNLVLKGRTTPTPTFEVLSRREDAEQRIAEGAAKHAEAFKLFCEQQFLDAKPLFMEAHDLLSVPDGGDGVGDRPSQHMRQLCDKYIEDPPAPDFDGREHLTKKAW